MDVVLSLFVNNVVVVVKDKTFWNTMMNFLVNRVKCSGVRQLHLEVFNAIQV